MNKTKLILTLFIAYLLLAPLSYKLLPYMGFYGADLSMQYNYHHCSILQNDSSKLYDISGTMCQDNINTHYAYPVLIYRFFSWAPLFNNFSTFYSFWTSLIILTLLALPFFWLKKTSLKGKCLYLGFGIISLTQAVSYFALERGGTDITFLIAWMIATYFGLREKWFLSGAFMAFAALLKLYPVMAIIPILIGIFIQEKANLKTHFFQNRFFYCSLGLGTIGILTLLLDKHLWEIFIFKILPNETKYHIGTNAIGHSLIGPFPKIVVYLVMLFFWLLYAKIFTHPDARMKRFAFAGTLGMSTYFTNHSFDYNLITLLPLIYIAGEFYFEKESPFRKNTSFSWSFALICLTAFGPSNLVFSPFHFLIRFKLIIQVTALGILAYTVWKEKNSAKNWRELLKL